MQKLKNYLKRMYANQLINEAEVQKTWAPVIESATGVTDKNKIAWMSKYCHFHNLNESVYNTVHLNPNMNVQGMGDVKAPGNPGTLNQFANQPVGSGDRAFSLLPLSMQVAAQTIGLDLVPVIPMQGPRGELVYMDFVYGGGRDAAIGGLNGNAAPLIVKVDLADGASVSGNGNGESVPCEFNAGDTISFMNGDETDYTLTFIGRSRLDGYAIFRVQSLGSNGVQQGGEMASKALYEYIRRGKVLDSSVMTTTAAYDTILCESNVEYVKALEDHIPGFSGAAFAMNDQGRNYPGGEAYDENGLDANGNNFSIDIDDIDPYERGYGESTPENLMGLSLFNKSVSAKTYQVAAAVTREQIQDLKQFGIDAVAQVESVLTNELTQNINKLILNRLFRLGTTNVRNLYKVNGTQFNVKFVTAQESTNNTVLIGKDNTNKVVRLPYTQVLVNGGGETQGTLQRRLLTKILACSNMIAIRGRRGPATFAVCSGYIATALQDCAGFVAYPMMNTLNQNGGSLYPVGTISGVTIYTDPNMSWNDTRILIGRKGNGQEPGLVFMPYLMAESVETIAEGTMAPKIAVKSRFGLVEAGFHPETMYMTIRVDCGNGVSLI